MGCFECFTDKTPDSSVLVKCRRSDFFAGARATLGHLYGYWGLSICMLMVLLSGSILGTVVGSYVGYHHQHQHPGYGGFLLCLFDSINRLVMSALAFFFIPLGFAFLLITMALDDAEADAEAANETQHILHRLDTIAPSEVKVCS